MGRTLTSFERVYVNGYDLSGYYMDTGERGVEFAEHESVCLSDAAVGYIPGKPVVTLGPIAGVYDNTATFGLHAVATGTTGTRRNIMVAIGDMAVPAMGSDAFCFPGYQTYYKLVAGDGVVGAVTAFSGPDVTAALNYTKFWGKLLHPYASEVAANTADANVDNGAATTAGGWLMYQIRAIGTGGTATISIDDSANGTTWAALSGATSGAIAAAGALTAGIVQLSTTATVRRYLRWQLALAGGATSCLFTLAFMRG